MKFCFFSPGQRSVHVLQGDTRQSGGAEAQVARLAATFADAGHQSMLIYGDGQATLRSTQIGKVLCVDAAPSWRRPNSLARLWRSLSDYRPDVIYARLPDDFLWILGGYAKRHHPTTFLYALAHDSHCTPWRSYTYRRWLHEPLYMIGLRLADIVLLQHEGQAALIAPHVRAPLKLVPNLAPTIAAQARCYADARIDAIWVAQIRLDKQLAVFLDLAEAVPDCHFALVGQFDPSFPQPLRMELEARMASIHNLAFLGPKRAAEVTQLLIQSKLLVNTSTFEGFPNTMLEAWSVGVPVVSLNVDPGHVIQREQIGRVSGTFENLCRDVEQIAHTSELNCAMGEQGLAYVRQQHSLEAVFRAFTAILPGLHAVPDGMQKELGSV